MIVKFFHAAVATSVVATAAWGAGAAVQNWLPEGKYRGWAESVVVAPGRTLYERLEKRKDVRQMRQAGAQKIADAAEKIREKATETAAGRYGLKAAERGQSLMHLYNVGAWSAAGFILCMLMTVVFGISSVKSALALGVKVTLTLMFLQAALLWAGVLAFQKMGG